MSRMKDYMLEAQARRRRRMLLVLTAAFEIACCLLFFAGVGALMQGVYHAALWAWEVVR